MENTLESIALRLSQAASTFVVSSRSWALELPAERLKDLKNIVAPHHHFSTVCAENPLLVIAAMLL